MRAPVASTIGVGLRPPAGWTITDLSDDGAEDRGGGEVDGPDPLGVALRRRCRAQLRRHGVVLAAVSPESAAHARRRPARASAAVVLRRTPEPHQRIPVATLRVALDTPPPDGWAVQRPTVVGLPIGPSVHQADAVWPRRTDADRPDGAELLERWVTPLPGLVVTLAFRASRLELRDRLAPLFAAAAATLEVRDAHG